MSVLAWLSFLKDEQRSEDGKGGKGTQDSSAYEGLAHRWRNEASARMYSIDDVIMPLSIRSNPALALMW